MPSRFGLPSSVRATPDDDPCPGTATVNQSAAATTIPATASKPIDRLLITSLYFPCAMAQKSSCAPTRNNRALRTCAAFIHAAPYVGVMLRTLLALKML